MCVVAELSAESVADEALLDRLVSEGPRVCFCCRACIHTALVYLRRAGLELRLIDGQASAENRGSTGDERKEVR